MQPDEVFSEQLASEDLENMVDVALEDNIDRC